MSRFQGQVAIVTGAGAGIGFAIAQHLAREGAQVLVNDLDADLAQASAAKIEAETGSPCIGLGGDAGKVPFIYAMVETAVAHFGKLDLAVANAGITLFGDFFEFSPENFQKVVELNLQGAFFLTQAAAKQMRKQGSGGSILLISSNVGYQAFVNLSAYAMSKSALRFLSRNLVRELGPHHIRINTLAPGATLTERTALEGKDYGKMWSEVIPLNKIAQVDDIARSALFLLSKDAGHITGQTLLVDGGWETTSPLPVEE
jgi:glucose 1-dehydrogenase